MSHKYFNGIIKNTNVCENIDEELKQVVVGAYKKVSSKMNELRISNALEEIMNVFRRANKYIDETMPWMLAKDESKQERLATVLYNLHETIIIGSSLLANFLPDTCEKVFSVLKTKQRELNEIELFGLYSETTLEEKSVQLFPRLDIKEVLLKAEEFKQKQLKEYMEQNKVEEVQQKQSKELITIDEFDKVELKIGEIIASEKVEKSDKLLKNTVKIGEEVRTIVSGIAKHYSPEEIVGKKVIVVTNLKPIKLRGIESSGMILCAVTEGDELLKLTSVDGDIPSGSEVC